MPSHRLTVSVPQPCHQDWQAMTPQFQGRFCQSCAKTVVDFTKMSDAEVANWLANQKGNTCGRFRQDQLGKELIAASSSKQCWSWRAAIFALLAGLTVKTADAQQASHKYVYELPTPPAFNQQQGKKPLKQAPTPSTNPRLIKGVVMDADSKQNMPGVTVSLKGTQIQTGTDIDGRFELIIPDNLPLEDQILTFSFIGMEYLEKKITDILKQEDAAISLASDKNVLTGEVVIVRTKWYSPRGLYYKAINLFR